MSRVRSIDKLLATPDILLLIIDHISTIKTLLGFRHTCRSIFLLTTAYQKTISSRIANTTFPNCKRLLLQPQPTKSARQQTIAWLVDLVPRHLAAILVDRHRYVGDPQMFGIPAEDQSGEALRARVANGFRILRKLSLISQRIHAISSSIAPPESTSTSTSTSSTNPTSSSPPSRLPLRQRTLSRLRTFSLRTPHLISTTKHIESLILERRLAYISILTTKSREDYQITLIFLIGAFQHLWGSLDNFQLDSVPDGPMDFGRPPRRWIGRRDSWANWYILHNGPGMFWEQWWVDRDPYVSARDVCLARKEQESAFEKMEREFLARDERVMKIEREAARKVEVELMKGLDHRAYNPPPELGPPDGHDGQLARLRRFRVAWASRREMGDALGCVAFRMDERRPVDCNCTAT